MAQQVEKEHKCIHRLLEIRFFRCHRCNSTYTERGFVCTLRGASCPIICQACFEHPPAPPSTPKGPGGMDLRDWFAGQAMAVLFETHLSRQRDESNPTYQPSVIATRAYDMADAMLEARKDQEA